MPVKLKRLTLKRLANRAHHKATAHQRRRKGGFNRWKGIGKKERSRIAKANLAKIPREISVANGKLGAAVSRAKRLGLPIPPTKGNKVFSHPHRKRIMVEPKVIPPSQFELRQAAEREMLRIQRREGTLALLCLPGKAPGQL